MPQHTTAERRKAALSFAGSNRRKANRRGLARRAGDKGPKTVQPVAPGPVSLRNATPGENFGR